MALPIDVTDPGSTGVETQAFGIGLPAQIFLNLVVTQPTSASSANNQRGDAFRPGLGVPTNVDNPDLVDVEDIVPLSVGLASNVAGGSAKPGQGIAASVDDPGNVEVEDQNVKGLGVPVEVSGNTSRISSFAVLNTSQNSVVGQTFGGGLPRNVNV